MSKDIQQLFSEFIYECKYLRNNRKDTIRNLNSVFDLFVNISGVTTLENLSSHTIKRFFQNLQERERIVGKGIKKTGVRPSTIISYARRLNSFFNWMVKMKHLKDNPLADVSLPKLSYEDRKFLCKEDVEKILTSLYLHNLDKPMIFKRNILIFHILLFCGIRSGELLGIQLTDIDVEARLLKVRAETSKSGRTRLIPLHPTIIAHLRDYLRERTSYKTSYLLVSLMHDDGLTKDGFKHLISEVRKRSGVKFHPHQLRHTFAVNFLKSSNNLAKLQQILGHQSIIMTTAYLRCLPPTEMKIDIDSMYIDNFI